MKAAAGTRTFYTDHCDEHMPCDGSLEGWAAYYAGNGKHFDDDDDEEPADGFPWPDGATFDATAILWAEDIVATREAGVWSLSREPEPGIDFAAVRFGAGAGWTEDNIVNVGLNSDLREIPGETLTQAIQRFLTENDSCCQDTEFIALGTSENGWMLTLHHGTPPTMTAERKH